MTVAQSKAFGQLLHGLGGGLFRHGDCVGADKEAHDIARVLGWRICVHPPDIPRSRAWCVFDDCWPAKPYLVRNRDIVDNCDRLIAVPRATYEEIRSGTWSTIRYARKIERKLYIIWPNGSVLTELV